MNTKMNLKELDLGKLTKLTSDYVDELKCIECCKFTIAPATAACGHFLCHTCWRGRRTCPICTKSVDRKLLKLNLPLQNLTNHVQTLGETFEKLFKVKLDEFVLDTPEENESEKDPVKHVKDWLTNSQNHFSAPIQSSEPLTQESEQPSNPLEISASNVIIHTDAKKVTSPSKVAKVAYKPPPPQDDWDKIEPMPDVDSNPITENIVGPMDIEPYFLDDNEYTNDNPRRSSRKRDNKQNDSNKKSHEVYPNKQNSRDSSCENDKKSHKGKQTWNNVKRMRKEFSKLNKENRNKLNISIEMGKKTQNIKPINRNTQLVATQDIVNIDDNTPENTDKENEIVVLNSDMVINQNTDKDNNLMQLNKDPNSDNISNDINNENKNQDQFIKASHNSKDNDSTKLNKDPNTDNILIANNIDSENKNNSKNNSIAEDKTLSKQLKDLNKTQQGLDKKEETKMPFIKKCALCPKNIQCDEESINPEHYSVSGNSDDIEISIKIGLTVTNIVIKKKNEVQVKINTDREVQTSLGTENLPQKEAHKGENAHNIDINVENSGKNKPNTQINVNKNATTQVLSCKVNKSTSEKKNTASADTATVQFEITESVEKELSNVMEYETEDNQQNASKNVKNTNDVASQNANKIQHTVEQQEAVEDLNDLDIFNSGSVKEANIHYLKEHAPSEILISTVGSKLKTQKHAEKRNREENTDEILQISKKAKVSAQQNTKDKSLPDSEPINYDVIMGQVFASIDADMEDIQKSQNIDNKTKEDLLKNKDLSDAQKTQVIKIPSRNNSQMTTTKLQECYNEKHSENVFSILEKDEEDCELTKIDKIPQQVEDLLTPVLCRNLTSSQESNDDSQQRNKSNKKSQDHDDSDRSVVEETPQKDISIPKLKRASTSNQSQVALSETKKIPSKISAQSTKCIINLSDTVTDRSSRNVTIIEPARKLTLETPLTITKFADHIIHKSTPVARKSLNFEDDDDPEQTLCPTSDIAKTTQEKEFMSKAFERTPPTPSARPLMARNIVSKANRKYCLAGSCLTSAEIANVKILCAQRKWTYIDKYTKDITHLVVGVDEEKKSQRSVKYMCALAASKWIVSFDWIKSCLQNKDIVDEESFEALDSTGEPGPRRSRIAKQKLFQGIKFYCMPPFSVLDVDTLKNMLMAAGGRVMKEMKEVKVSDDNSEPALLLAEPEHTQEDRFIYLAMEQGIVPVNYEWVLNCLGSYSLGSIQELLLCPSSLLPASTTRWPEILLTQDSE